MHYKLIKIKCAIYLALTLSTWWQKPLGKTNGLRCHTLKIYINFRVHKNVAIDIVADTIPEGITEMRWEAHSKLKN